MANENINKVVLSTGEVLLDLTQDDVKPEHVEKGIKFHDKTGSERSGTSTKTVDASGATVEAAEILAGRTAGKGASLIVGTMPDNSGKNVELSTTAPVTVPKGYTDGGTVAKISDTELAKIIPANIKEGVQILGITGEYGADDISSQSKTITPSFAEQNVQPDAGYTFLSGVTVAAIPVTRVDNDAGGVTVTIG